GGRIDFFEIKQGSRAAVRLGRALGYAAANFFTFGAWELIGSSVETNVGSAQIISVRVMYRFSRLHREDVVTRVHFKHGDEWLTASEIEEREEHTSSAP
ncbi:MAG: hypothetical protein GDA54_07090, partial [Alphaproteobacteria bacterium GM7ARS4]|nr:hypothetical protein [Alphaproteobacteria bacterium GM7ARS4]